MSNRLLSTLRGYDRDMRLAILTESTDPTNYLIDLAKRLRGEPTPEEIRSARTVIDRLVPFARESVAGQDDSDEDDDFYDEEDNECARMGHDDETTWSDEETGAYQWSCSRCGAEGWGGPED